MLDFYLIQDTETKPNGGPNLLTYVGGLEYDDFEYLQKINIIEAWLDFYKDFRWTYEQVNEKYHKLSSQVIKKFDNQKHKSSMSKMFQILERAVNKQMGIIAYCD